MHRRDPSLASHHLFLVTTCGRLTRKISPPCCWQSRPFRFISLHFFQLLHDESNASVDINADTTYTPCNSNLVPRRCRHTHTLLIRLHFFGNRHLGRLRQLVRGPAANLSTPCRHDIRLHKTIKVNTTGNRCHL